jgi:arylsulfatase A-like enzyme
VPVIILVADGARPDGLAAAIDGGALPALARLRAEGGAFTVTSTFPSVTGPAYAPFLMGRYPGPVGLPALRWFDRTRSQASFPHYTRSYVGHEMRHVDRDLATDAPTLFELAPRALGSLSVIQRGLARKSRLGAGARFALRAARTHFSGDAARWLDIDRDMGREVASRVRAERPDFVFAALTGIDKASHAAGHDHGLVAAAMRIVDEVVAELRDDAERGGWWEETHLWIVSDHGHSPVTAHDDLAAVLEDSGRRVVAHPWIYRAHPDVAVMVSGNAMAHLYLDLDAAQRPWWPALGERWGELADMLVQRPSVDLALLPQSPTRCEVVSATRGRAVISLAPTAGDRLAYTYRTTTGDPLGIGAELAAVSGDEAYEATIGTDYPDSVVQVAHLAGASRSGEIILSAAREWDFRARYEPIPHRSSHGALHREHMLVPLIVNRPPDRTPRRTVDVMPSALAALGIPAPPLLDGRSFLDRSS